MNRMTVTLIGSFILSAFLVGTAVGQVNESELATFFKLRGYTKHNIAFKKRVKVWIGRQLKKYPKGSPGFDQAVNMNKHLRKDTPEMQAPPFLDINNCNTGDIGMLYHTLNKINGKSVSPQLSHLIPYMVAVQIVDKERTLMKFSFNSNALKEDWKGPFLLQKKEGTAVRVATSGQVNTGNRQIGKVSETGLVYFQSLGIFSYKNRLGGTTQVPTFKVLSPTEWAKMVTKYK